jgi:uncharacterized membrane protein YcaP (DUF421 family)
MKNHKVKLIFRFFKGAKRYFIAAVIASLFTTVLNSLTPQIFRFTVDDVLAALRQKDIFDINEVAFAVIETNGTLSVLLKPQFQNATKQDVKVKTKNDGYTCPVIIDGVVMKKNLSVLKIKMDDVEKILRNKKVNKREVFLMNMDKNKNAEIILKE